MLDRCQAWTPQSDGREPQLKDDTGEGSQAALTDVAALLSTRNLSLDFPSALLHAHLPLLGGFHQLPAVGLEVVELIKLHADVLNGQLQQVPEPCQVLGCWTGVGIRVLWGRWGSVGAAR